MIKRISILAFALLWISFSQAQQQIVFEDDFSDHLKDWRLIRTKEFTVNLNDGVLNFGKKTSNRINSGCLWYKRTINQFFAERDFSIAFDAKGVQSESNTHLFDFQWGKLQEYDGVTKKLIYQLDFFKDKLRLGRFELRKGWKYYSWSTDLLNPSVNQFHLERDNFNHYEIIQKDNLLTVKINGEDRLCTSYRTLGGK